MARMQALADATSTDPSSKGGGTAARTVTSPPSTIGSDTVPGDDDLEGSQAIVQHEGVVSKRPSVRGMFQRFKRT
jgi:hypothetical protein